jgi:hypothetical protein
MSNVLPVGCGLSLPLDDGLSVPARIRVAAVFRSMTSDEATGTPASMEDIHCRTAEWSMVGV